MLLLVAAIDVLARYLPAVQALEHGRNDVTQAQALLTGDLAHLNQARVAQARYLLSKTGQPPLAVRGQPGPVLRQVGMMCR